MRSRGSNKLECIWNIKLRVNKKLVWRFLKLFFVKLIEILMYMLQYLFEVFFTNTVTLFSFFISHFLHGTLILVLLWYSLSVKALAISIDSPYFIYSSLQWSLWMLSTYSNLFLAHLSIIQVQNKKRIVEQSFKKN